MTIDEQIIENERKINDLIKRGRAMVAAGRDDEACRTLLPEIRGLQVAGIERAAESPRRP
jgi:hypothetical protein